ncbi:uncharacterized protein LOC109718850 [Ananas comosus]|uniref:Uncharacterized protein LOC109718850 n=1 Tax=Ananas comosus TaxID=4615 RepID=A0A6P5FZ79_ANACO|nr:uncharacterized protein LOC109718850 [Ananas comosus]
MSVRARYGAFYFITVIDNHTRFGHVYLIFHRSEALNCFRRYIYKVENQLDMKIKILRTDRGHEYLSEQFKELCDENLTDRSLTEIELRDVEFLEEDFSYRSEVRNKIEFHEMDDSDIGASIRSVETEEATSIPPRDSGSDLPLEKEPQLCRSTHMGVPHRRFEIEGKVFMVAAHNDDELMSFQEALSSPTHKERLDAMVEEIESMKSNHVWNLVDLPPGRKTIGNK